jgi:hypothetical protein
MGTPFKQSKGAIYLYWLKLIVTPNRLSQRGLELRPY